MKQKVFGCLAMIACVLAACRQESQPMEVKSITVQKEQVYYRIKGLEKPFTVMFMADTHFTLEDERGKPYYDYSRRMGGEAVEPENYGKSNGREKSLVSSLKKGQQEKVSLVILGGDILNFPSLASVEYLKKLLDDARLPWVYTAGNHDWHYEGEAGSSMEQRKRWTESHLMPLYQGNHPLYHAQVIHGINFVTIDNSVFEITPEQLSFFQGEVAKGLPIVLAMHIPIYVEGHNIDYGCGNPTWNADHDIYYEIERREPWPAEGFTETTCLFRDCVLHSPSVIGIYAGHTHEKAIDFLPDKIQYVTDAHYAGSDVMIHFLPSLGE